MQFVNGEAEHLLDSSEKTTCRGRPPSRKVPGLLLSGAKSSGGWGALCPARPGTKNGKPGFLPAFKSVSLTSVRKPAVNAGFTAGQFAPLYCTKSFGPSDGHICTL